jgi:hypothetical protein
MAIKIIWGLIKAFANILLLTIFAPIQFALGPLIPNFGFGKWIKSYITNLSVFVVTGVLALFAWIFLLMAWAQMFTGSDLTLSTTITSSPWPPLLGSGGSANLLFVGVSFVIFTMIPKANELVQSFLSGKPFAYGSGIGEVFGPVKWGAGQIYNQSGARDAMGAIQAVRKARTVESLFGENRPLREVAVKLAGGGTKAEEQINKVVNQAKEGRN